MVCDAGTEPILTQFAQFASPRHTSYETAGVVPEDAVHFSDTDDDVAPVTCNADGAPTGAAPGVAVTVPEYADVVHRLSRARTLYDYVVPEVTVESVYVTVVPPTVPICAKFAPLASPRHTS